MRGPGARVPAHVTGSGAGGRQPPFWPGPALSPHGGRHPASTGRCWAPARPSAPVQSRPSEMGRTPGAVHAGHHPGDAWEQHGACTERGLGARTRGRSLAPPTPVSPPGRSHPRTAWWRRVRLAVGRKPTESTWGPHGLHSAARVAGSPSPSGRRVPRDGAERGFHGEHGGTGAVNTGDEKGMFSSGSSFLAGREQEVSTGRGGGRSPRDRWPYGNRLEHSSPADEGDSPGWG